MSEQCNWKFNVQVVGGPMIAASGEQTVDAYSKSQVVVPARTGSTDGQTELTLDTTGASILIVRASRYVDPDNPATRLQYAVTAGGTAGTAVNLIGPLILIGEDAIRLLGNPVERLTFTNPTASEITIDTLVGVDATP
ncbi:MAG: hypothetical protein N838_32345 [Thiohalocapsa sp. PB-PSB1]|jgi:hypothetical protein|nr:MAG: hypothetical protein N838_32345 [Thiohalocapsa sp. PB-PSB1]HCS88849.1 hypothetical protein [Chromatiaceae bacterium]